MIEGWEQETDDLNAAERELIPGICKGLSLRVGRGQAVTAAEITKGFAARGVKVPGPRVRKLINHVRRHGLVPNLVASSAGYYVATDDEDKARYIRSLHARAEAILAVAAAFQKSKT